MLSKALQKQFPRGRWWERDPDPCAQGRRTRVRSSQVITPRRVQGDPDRPIDFGTGDDASCAPAGTSLVSDPNCRGFVPICGMRKVGGLIRAQAGVAAWGVNIVPTTNQYFLPRAIRALVLDNQDPQLQRRAFVTGVSINNFPQESVHTVPAIAGTTAGWFTDDWSAPDGYAVPIPWGIFSIAALIQNLVINGWSFYAAGILCDIQFTLYGHPFEITDAPGCKVGPTMTEAAKDRFASRLMRNQAGSAG